MLLVCRPGVSIYEDFEKKIPPPNPKLPHPPTAGRSHSFESDLPLTADIHEMRPTSHARRTGRRSVGAPLRATVTPTYATHPHALRVREPSRDAQTLRRFSATGARPERDAPLTLRPA